MGNFTKGLVLLLLYMCSVSISNAQLQSIDILVDNDITCENDTVQLNIHIVQNGYNNLQFDWNNEDVLNSSTIVNPKAFPSATTTFTVVVTDLDNSITFTDSIKITVLPKPVIYAGDDMLVCINQNHRVINAYALNTTNFEWSHNGQGQLLQTGTLTPVYIPKSGELGEIQIVLRSKGILQCQDVTDTLKLQYVGSPEITLQNKTDTICTFENYIIKQPLIVNATSFKWTHNGNGTLLNNNTLTPEYIPEKEETGVVELVIACSNYDLCTVTDTMSLTVVAKPVIEIDEREVSICSKSSYYFSGNKISHATQFKWSHNGKGRLYNVSSVNPAYIPANDEAEKVQIYIEATGKCGVAIDTVTLNFFNADALDMVTDTMTCSNQSIELSAPEGFTYLWGTGETTSSIEVSPQKNSTYSVTITNDQGCFVEQFINVEVSNINIQITPDTTICQGSVVELSVTSSPEFSYSWDTGAPTNSIVVQPDFNKEYSVTVTNEDGCTESALVYVELRNPPEIDIEKLIDIEETLIVTPDNLANYKFGNFEEVFQEGFSNTFNYSFIADRSTPLLVEVSDDFGCTYEESIDLIEFDPTEDDFPIANAFSPNGDLINDRFLENYPQFRVVVFDRSNKILYDGYDGWDGRSNGKDMPAGTYYHITYDSNGEIVYKGPVTIVR